MKTTADIESLKPRILKEILDQGWNEGHPVPSNEEFSQILRCSPDLVEQAMGKLVQEGILSASGRRLLVPRPLVDEGDRFSLTRTAAVLRKAIMTQVLEQTIRSPADEEYDANLAFLDRRAQSALGLSRDEQLMVISRLRCREDGARLIQSAYLDPKRFPEGFLDGHNFARDSLIHTYRELGFQIQSRDTTLTARYPTVAERNYLGIRSQPVLGVEQSLSAIGSGGEAPFVLEYMAACYHGWRYRIANRLPPV